MVDQVPVTDSHAVPFGQEKNVAKEATMGYLDVPGCCHPSGTAQTTGQVVSSAASPSWHAHLCQSEMPGLFQVCTPAKDRQWHELIACHMKLVFTQPGLETISKFM